MEQLYLDAVLKFGSKSDPLLFTFYVDFLLAHDQVIKALHFLSIYQNLPDVARQLGRERCFRKVREYLLQQNSRNIYEQEY